MVNILVDADSIFFKIAYGTTGDANLKKAYKKFCADMERKVKGHFFADEFNVMYAVKGNGNFRKDLYPEYKASRKPLEDEMREKIGYLWNYSLELGAIAADGMEADDLVCIWANESRADDQQFVICGIDKDLKQIPGNHYNYHKDTWDFVDDDQANLNLMLQCLTGDSTDNIPGIKGIGPKKAAKILEGIPMERRWNRIRAAWRGHVGNTKQLSISYHLLRMLTTWDEFNDVKTQVSSEATERERYDWAKQNLPDSSIHRISE